MATSAYPSPTRCAAGPPKGTRVSLIAGTSTRFAPASVSACTACGLSAETLIAVALITGFARKVTYIAAIVFSVLIWSTAEGFGGPYTSGASDIGTAVIYAVVFAGLLALSYYAGPARYSADYYLEKKISWW